MTAPGAQLVEPFHSAPTKLSQKGAKTLVIFCDALSVEYEEYVR